MDAIPKTYLYKMYKGTTYLGVLQDVTSEFEYSQDINSAAVQLQVTVNASADVAGLDAEPLLDEDGNELKDENGETLYEERRPDLVGSSNPRALIQENNNLKVYEISADDPNGVLVFDGWIESWEANFGGGDDNISFLAISKAVDLVEYVIGGTVSVDVSQTTSDSQTAAALKWEGTHDWDSYGQTFEVGVGITHLYSITVKIKTTDAARMYIALYNTPADANVDMAAGNNLSNARGVTSTQEITNTGFEEVNFAFPNPVAVTAGNNYFFAMQAEHGTDGSEGLTARINLSSVYADGDLYNPEFSAGVASYGIDTGTELYFKTFGTNNNITAVYASQDPTNILKDAVDRYSDAGGSADYIAGSTDDTGLSVSYTFKLATVLEVIQKCLELAPSDWYWFVHPGTQTLYFKQTATTATHRFIRGKHIENLKIVGTVENVRNTVYFSGGDTGAGENLFIKLLNSAALSEQGRPRLELISDNRVTLSATGSLIAQNLLDERAAIAYSSPVSILAETYDVDSINVGDTVQITGFGNFVDHLTLQIARVTRRADRIELVLGILLRRQSEAISAALAAVEKLETVDNPDAPS